MRGMAKKWRRIFCNCSIWSDQLIEQIQMEGRVGEFGISSGIVVRRQDNDSMGTV
jgi:hypothetical protein